MKPRNPKILIVEHDSANIKLIHDELEKSKINFTSEIVHTRKEYKKALLNFKPDIILSHYTFPDFDGPAAFKIKKKLSPETPYFFVSESIGEENAIEWIKKGVSDFVLKGNLSSLAPKMNRALEEATISKSNREHQQVEEKRIEELSYNAQKYYSVIESSMDAILLTVKDGEILEANTAACEMFQMTREEIYKSGRFDIVDNEDPRLQLLLEERNQTGKARGELTFKRKDGSRFPGEITSVVFTDADGLEKTSMTIKDISERNQAEQKQIVTFNALQQALNDLNNTLDSSLDVICSFDEEGRFVSVNAASEHIWGYTPEELLGKKYIDFVFQEDIKNTLEEEIKIRGDAPASMFENRYIHKNGSMVPMLWSCIWVEKDKKSYAVAKDATEKKKLEKAFNIERQRFLDLYSHAPSCMGILKGPDYVYELANPLYLKLIDKKDIIGKTVKEVLPELEAQGVFNFLDSVYHTGETFSANEMLVKFDFHGNGQLVDTYLNFIYQAHRNIEGIIDGILFFVNDVTEQVVSRKKIEESENRFRALIEKSEEMIILSDADGKILYSSPSVMKILGFSMEELLNQLTSDYIHPDDINIFKEKRSEILETPGASFNHQQRLRDKNGNWIWCESMITNMMDEPGVYALVINLRDINDKKIIEQQKEFDRKNLNALINNTEDLMWSVDRDFKLITSNKPFKEITTSILGKKIKKGTNILATRFSPDMINHYKISCERAFTGTPFTEIEYRETPVEMWAEISYYPIRKDNQIIGTACHSRNITVQKQNELNLEKRNEELLKTNSELDRFVYSVSHDLRSPLTSILGLISFIEDESQETETLEHIAMIRKSINRLDVFIRNILNYSRNNRTGLKVEIISPQETTNEIVEALRGMDEAEGIDFEIDISEKQPFYSDRIRFNTVLENLISNAIKYHHKDHSGRYIKITGQSDKDQLQLTIADNGIGIAPEHHKKIFDMFFRLSGKKDGSGIGLYIVKDTVQILQGSITVLSEEGKGTSFHITFKNLKP